MSGLGNLCEIMLDQNNREDASVRENVDEKAVQASAEDTGMLR
jgi:hypothetical protein